MSPPPQTSHKFPAKFPASRYKSSSLRSSAHTSSIPRDRTHETYPNYSNVPPDSNCKAKPAAHIHAYEKSRQVFPIAPKAFRHSPIPAATSQWHENIPNSAPLSRSRRKPPTLPAFPQPPGQDCSSAFEALLPAATPCTKSPSRAPRETAPSKAPYPPLFSPYSSLSSLLSSGHLIRLQKNPGNPLQSVI